MRIPPNAKGDKGAIPVESALVKFHFGKEDPRHGKRVSEDRAYIWTGRGVRPSKVWFAITQTDLCVMLIMPPNGEARLQPRAISSQQATSAGED